MQPKARRCSEKPHLHRFNNPPKGTLLTNYDGRPLNHLAWRNPAPLLWRWHSAARALPAPCLHREFLPTPAAERSPLTANDGACPEQLRSPVEPCLAPSHLSRSLPSFPAPGRGFANSPLFPPGPAVCPQPPCPAHCAILKVISWTSNHPNLETAARTAPSSRRRPAGRLYTHFADGETEA